MFFFLELYYFFYLIVIFFLHLEQYFTHFGEVHTIHLVIKSFIVTDHTVLKMNLVSQILTLVFHKQIVVFIDSGFIFLSRRVRLYAIAILNSVNFLPVRITRDTYTFEKLFLIFRKLIFVFLKNHLYILDSSSFKSKYQNHVINFILV